MSANRGLDTKQRDKAVYVDMQQWRDVSVLFIGTIHGVESIEDEIYNRLDLFSPDAVLYEEHMYDGFSPKKVSEHSVIQDYTSENLNVDSRSMDIPANSDNLDCLGDVVDEMTNSMPQVNIDSLSDKQGMIHFNGRFESDNPQLFSFIVDFRNQKMAREIYKRSIDSNVDKIACIVGQCHIFGSCSIQSRLKKLHH